MESKEILTMRLVLKEEAKGKLKAMLNTYWDDGGDEIIEKVESFISEVLDEL